MVVVMLIIAGSRRPAAVLPRRLVPRLQWVGVLQRRPVIVVVRTGRHTQWVGVLHRRVSFDRRHLCPQLCCVDLSRKRLWTPLQSQQVESSSSAARRACVSGSRLPAAFLLMHLRLHVSCWLSISLSAAAAIQGYVVPPTPCPHLVTPFAQDCTSRGPPYAMARVATASSARSGSSYTNEIPRFTSRRNANKEAS